MLENNLIAIAISHEVIRSNDFKAVVLMIFKENWNMHTLNFWHIVSGLSTYKKVSMISWMEFLTTQVGYKMVISIKARKFWPNICFTISTGRIIYKIITNRKLFQTFHRCTCLSIQLLLSIRVFVSKIEHHMPSFSIWYELVPIRWLHLWVI